MPEFLFARFTSDSQANVAEAGNGFSGLRKPEGSFRGTPSSIAMENWDEINHASLPHIKHLEIMV